MNLPIIKALPSGLYAITREYSATFPCRAHLWRVTLQPGFAFDGASVPRILWPVSGSPYDPPRVAAAAIHDWLYRAQICSRAEADEAYLLILMQSGISPARAFAEYAALRLFGRPAWAAHESSPDRSRGSLLTTTKEIQ